MGGKISRKKKIKLFAVDMIYLLIACAMYAFAVECVLVPNGLTTGGVTGVIRMLQTFIPLDFSIMYYIASGLIILSVLIFLGRKEAQKIILMALLFPATLLIFEHVKFDLIHGDDKLLASIFCGIFMGACVGITSWRGYSFCGSDAIAKIIKKKIFPEVSLSKCLLAIDTSVIVSSIFFFDRNIALYAVVSQIIISKTMDLVIFGVETKLVRMDIISSIPNEVADYVMNELSRGVSRQTIIGGYTGNEKIQLTVLCSPRESILIRRFLSDHDPSALAYVVQVGNAWGSGTGFDDIAKEKMY